MAMIATDRLTDGQLIDLPPEAGNVLEPRFEPQNEWLEKAPALEQKTAMWRWFATHYEELETSTPHDPGGEYFFGRKRPVEAAEVLRQRFARWVPSAVLDAFIDAVRREGGDRWAVLELDKLSS